MRNIALGLAATALVALWAASPASAGGLDGHFGHPHGFMHFHGVTHHHPPAYEPYYSYRRAYGYPYIPYRRHDHYYGYTDAYPSVSSYWRDDYHFHYDYHH